MNRRKISIILVGIALLLLSSMTASAVTESDGQGDIWHFVAPYWKEQTVSNQPNIDIKEIKAEESGDQITLSMSLWPGGTFTPSSNKFVMCLMWYNTSDAWYSMSYSYFEGEEAFSIGMVTSVNGQVLTGDVTVNDVGDTISTTLNKMGDDTTTVEMYGTTLMYEDRFGEKTDQWHDWVGDYIWNPDFEPGDSDDDGEDDETGDDDGTGDGDTTGGDDDTTGGTPGFEVIGVLTALWISLILIKRRK